MEFTAPVRRNITYVAELLQASQDIFIFGVASQHLMKYLLHSAQQLYVMRHLNQYIIIIIIIIIIVVIHCSVSHQCCQGCRSCSFKKNSEIQYTEPQLPFLPRG
jgi:hypothetical protein